MNKEKPLLDPSIQKFYTEGNEKDRLTNHRLEMERTLRILKRHLPSSPAVILDIGGAAGVYSYPLQKMGHEVHLIDPIPLHIRQAEEHGKEISSKLASYSIGDARKIEWEDNSVDVVLFLGPLYHLVDKKDRLQALNEAYRVLKPEGILFAAGISRFASFMDAIHKGTLTSKLEVIEQEFTTGIHRKITEDFTFAYLHHPKELANELEESGFQDVTVRAIEGPVWEKQVIEALQKDEKVFEKLLDLLEKIETEETIIGASAHIMAIANKL